MLCSMWAAGPACASKVCETRWATPVRSSGSIRRRRWLRCPLSRVARHGWDNITIVQAPVETAAIPVMADAALFCAVHDVLQSPAALANVFDHLRPGAWVAAGGGKYAPEWMVMMNPMIRAQHRPYIRSFDGFDRPWARLEEFATDLRVDEFSLGAGYVAVGRAHSRGSAQAGSPPTAWPAIAPVTDRLAAIST